MHTKKILTLLSAALLMLLPCSFAGASDLKEDSNMPLSNQRTWDIRKAQYTIFAKPPVGWVGDVCHAFYTGNNPHFYAQGKPREYIRHAIGTDLTSFTKLEDETFTMDALEGYNTVDFRDPFLFRNEEKGEWWLLITATVKLSDNARAAGFFFGGDSFMKALAVELDMKHELLRYDSGLVARMRYMVEKSYISRDINTQERTYQLEVLIGNDIAVFFLNGMHWGHWRSADLVHWEDMPVAVAPDCKYDSFGCFSGTAMPDGQGGAHVLYTGVYKDENGDLQQQCYAHFDGEKIVKHAQNPVMPFAMLPEGYVRQDFRDPCLIPSGDGWRAVMAARYKDETRLVCCSSNDLVNWTHNGQFMPTVSNMPECPDVFDLDGKTVVWYSCVDYAGELTWNPRPVVYSVGHMLDNDTRFEGSPLAVLDYGADCYATQSCEGQNGQRIAINWMASWAAKFPTEKLGHEWSGMMTMPRLITRCGDRLVQQPVPAMADARKHQLDAAQPVDAAHPLTLDVCAKHAEIQLEADVSGAQALTIELMRTGDEAVRLTWQNDELTLDRSALALCSENGMAPRMSMPLKAVDGRISLQAFVDACTVEVFAAGETMTALAFPTGKGYGVSVLADGAADVKLTCWEIG